MRLQVLWSPTEDIEFLVSGRTAEQNIRTGFFENVSSVLPGQLTPGVPNPVLDGYVDTDGDVWAGDYDEPGFNDLKTRGLTGTLKWDFAGGASFNSSPAMDSLGNIYIGNDDGFVYALTPEGELLWSFEADAGVVSSPAIGANGGLYFGIRMVWH